MQQPVLDPSGWCASKEALSVIQAIGDCGGARVELDEKSFFAGEDVRETVS
jgi:hypothetical protein